MARNHGDDLDVRNAMKNPAIPSFRRARLLTLLIAVATMALAACGTAGSPASSASPGAPSDPGSTPETTPGPGTIEHETGATDVVFRFDEGGGFVPMGFFATEAPIFTLYGDGTVIFKDGNAAPPPEADGIIRTVAYRTIKLTEDQVQAFLHGAISESGLGVARADYGSIGADLPTATFTINAAGTTKVVNVMALGMDRGEGADTLILQALAGLGERIRDFGREVDGEQAWVPDRWRGVLTPDAFNPPRAWPWPEIVPADFIQHPEPGAPQFPVRTMSSGEIAALGFAEIDGGFSSLGLSGPDGRLYLFALRPLFPEEQY
jgi:hypothetical protein